MAAKANVLAYQFSGSAHPEPVGLAKVRGMIVKHSGGVGLGNRNRVNLQLFHADQHGCPSHPQTFRIAAKSWNCQGKDGAPSASVDLFWPSPRVLSPTRKQQRLGCTREPARYPDIQSLGSRGGCS